MRHFGTEERRTRLARRHHLTASTKQHDVATVARSLIGLHGTDPVSIFLAARARMHGATVASIEHALYDDRTIVRVLAMRRTLFVIPVDLLPVIQVAASDAVATNERKRLVTMIDAAGIATNPERWLRSVSEETLSTLREMGGATAAQLTARVPRLRKQVVLGPGTRWETTQNVGLRVVPLLGMEGHIARGRPLGSWISTQHRWEPIENWLALGTDLPDLADARAQLVTWWLQAFGPGLVTDIKWWTGWTLGQTRVALAAAGAIDVDVDGTAGVALPSDLDEPGDAEPWVALLPSLDPSVMAWQERTWFLGPHKPEVFDRAGNAGPTVFCDGRVVGIWGQSPSGDVRWKLFEDVGSDAAGAIDAEAAALTEWLGATRITPRFGPRWGPS